MRDKSEKKKKACLIVNSLLGIQYTIKCHDLQNNQWLWRTGMTH